MSGYLHTTLETVGRNEAQIKLSSKVSNVHKHTSFKIRLGESRTTAMPDELFEEAERLTYQGGYEVGSNFYKGDSDGGSAESTMSSNVEGDSSDVEEQSFDNEGGSQDPYTGTLGYSSYDDSPSSTATGSTLEANLEAILNCQLGNMSAEDVKGLYDEALEGEASNKSDRVKELISYAFDLEDEDRAVFLEDKIF